jgi:hypothetical protein
MKIRVQHKDGTMETITLVPPITDIRDGERLHSLKCGDGTDHYFTPEGYYDGWGRAVNATFDEAQQIIQHVQEGRERGEKGT